MHPRAQQHCPPSQHTGERQPRVAATPAGIGSACRNPAAVNRGQQPTSDHRRQHRGSCRAGGHSHGPRRWHAFGDRAQAGEDVHEAAPGRVHAPSARSTRSSKYSRVRGRRPRLARPRGAGVSGSVAALRRRQGRRVSWIADALPVPGARPGTGEARCSCDARRARNSAADMAPQRHRNGCSAADTCADAAGRQCGSTTKARAKVVTAPQPRT